jgi:uncharacterized membrane protein
MKIIAIAYIAVLVVMGVLDGAWLSFSVSRLYKPGIGHLMADQPVAWAAVLFYLLYAAGVTYLITLPALATGGPGSAAVRGAVLGVIAYGTYDLTSLAIMRGWPVNVTLIDMVWGGILTGVSATLAVVITRKFG